MKLQKLIDVLGNGTQIRVATSNGRGWLVATTTKEFYNSAYYNELSTREVINVYIDEEREEQDTCCALEPGICIIVTGFENGRI